MNSSCNQSCFLFFVQNYKKNYCHSLECGKKVLYNKIYFLKEASMEFNSNSIFLYLVASVVILFVLAQSVFFLVRAYKRANAIGMDLKRVRKMILSTALFTIAPAISILMGVLTLSKFLGIPLPWIRLSVIGAITYELPAATSTASAMGFSLSETITDPQAYSTIAWVMTLGILPSIVLVPILLKRIQSGMGNIQKRDRKWGQILMDAMFLGMISAFLGLVFADLHTGIVGFIPLFVLLCSAVLMGICGILVKKLGWKQLETFALSISMIGAMIFAIFLDKIIS